MTDQTRIVADTTRHDGWTQERIAQFLDHLANHGSVTAACGRVGMSREAAYRLRRRSAAFTRAWTAALLLARELSAEVLEIRAIDGIEEEVWHHGEVVGTRRKYDSRLLLAHMARLDKLADDADVCTDAGRFDELVALACGEPAPSNLLVDGVGLPLPREANVVFVGGEARDALHTAWLDAEPLREERLDRAGLSGPERIDAQVAEDMEHETDCEAEARREGQAAGRAWDAWRSQALATVDRLLAASCSRASGSGSGTSSTSSTSGTPGSASGRESADGAAIRGES